jgi:transposase
MSSFDGLTDEQWNMIEPHIPFMWGIQHKGNPPLHPRKVLNTILWVLFTGARWKDVPHGEQWASRPCAHKKLGVWLENGVLEKVLKALQDIGVVVKALDLSRLSVDGFFFRRKGRGRTG